jgi:hypothetical protein
MVLFCLLIQCGKVGGFDACLADEIGWRVKSTVFNQNGIYIIAGHGALPVSLAIDRAYTALQFRCK